MILATPLHDAKSKKLMRADALGSGDTVELEVAARGATISKHQQQEPYSAVASAVKSVNLTEDGIGDGNQTEAQRLEAIKALREAEAEAAENAAPADPQVTCDDTGFDAGVKECFEKCGNEELASWVLQCGYGSVHPVSDVCVYKSQHETLAAEKCAELGDTPRGNLWCHEQDLFIGCNARANASANATVVATNPGDTIPKSGVGSSGKNATLDSAGQNVYNANGSADLAHVIRDGQVVTDYDLNHSVTEIKNIFENLVEDKSIPYVPDPDANVVCKWPAGHNISVNGKTYGVSVAKFHDVDAENKKCSNSFQINSTTSESEGDSKAFEHGRVLLCAEYAAVASQAYCGTYFYMDKDYFCHCPTTGTCTEEDETGSCIYVLNELQHTGGAPRTLEDYETYITNLDAINHAILENHMASGSGGE